MKALLYFINAVLCVLVEVVLTAGNLLDLNVLLSLPTIANYPSITLYSTSAPHSA